MEVHRFQYSRPVHNSIDPKDSKYLPRISTILVASMEEAKDKISQIQYIFCDQLYPRIEECIQNIYTEAKRVSDEEWKLRESILQNQINQLQNEKASAVSECNFLKQLKNEWYDMISEKESLLLRKDGQIEEEKEVQRKLCYLVAAKRSDAELKDMLIRRYKERVASLVEEVVELKEKNGLLASALEKKSEELTKLLDEVEVQREKIARAEALLLDKEGTQRLAAKVKQLQVSLDDLKIEVRKKDLDLYDQSKVREKLTQQNEEQKLEIVKMRNQLKVYEQDRKQPFSGIKVKEENIEDPETNNCAGSCERSEHYKILAQQIDLRTSELQAEKQKRRELCTAYKNLKSQYNFLCKKFNLTAENMLPKPKSEVNSQVDYDNMGSTSPETKDQSSPHGGGGGATRENILLIKQENIQERTPVYEKGRACRSSDQHRSSKSPSLINSPPTSSSKWMITGKSIPSSSKKRAASSEWRETRSRQVPPGGGGDPHDDFLDTPLEAMRGNLAKPPFREVEANIIPPGPAAAKNKTGCDSSWDDDVETQDMNAEHVVHRSNQLSNLPNRVDGKSFKFIEPVRKKAQRDNLKGIECKQCKKFYEAVLEDGSRDGGIRCEHHEGVSRHRYRYAPPLTPEGFWNIGFDSEV